MKATIASAKGNGTEKTITLINHPKGQFVKKDLYVVAHGLNGTVLANPVVPKLIGKNLSEI